MKSGVPFAGSIINSLLDIMTPNTKAGWLRYLENMNYIDSRGNILKDFEPTNYSKIRSALSSFFSIST